MKEAENLTNKISTPTLFLQKLDLTKIDENKLKQLDARIIGPSSDGNMPAEFCPLGDLDVEHIKSSKLR
jgi:hypothetical protein